PLDPRTLDPDDLAHSAWYYTPIARGRPSWVGPYMPQYAGDVWYCSYLVPIYSAGALIGVMGMDIPVETLAAPVSSTRVYDTGFASLFDAEGNTIYHPLLETGASVDLLDLTLDSALLQQADSGSEVIRYVANGERRQMSFSTMSNGMKVVVTAPVREINASWLRLANVIVFGSAAIIIIYLLLITLVMHYVTQPLLRLTAASRRLAAADYDVVLDYNGLDEVGELTVSFRQMRDKLKHYIDDLNRRIDTDELTGLPNMRCFFRLAEAERERLLAEGKHPVFLYFDVIGMKYYNRQYGFEAGDRLLCSMAHVLAEQYGTQRLCRFSEDHFAAVVDDAELAESIPAVFRGCKDLSGGNSLPIRVGIYPDETERVSVSVACDRAKYACDKNRGSYVSASYRFDSAMLKQIEDVQYIINHLDQALAEHWITVYYQPIIRAVNGRVCDEEALSRWIDPTRGFLSPGDFIPILERAHLIYKLDLYVLEEILKKMKQHSEHGLQVVPHSLNISRADFDSCDIVAEICRRVDAAGIARDRLTVEITESTVGSDFSFIKEQVQRLQALGFRVWMDDFGSGYSSLDMLQDIHFDLLKFDMRFMHRFGETESNKIILTELVRMAIALGIETVCEGVETKEQVDFLREVGCTKLQGFYYCKPIPFGTILKRYRDGTRIGFENPHESDYLSTIGRANLFALAILSDSPSGEHHDYYDTLPVGIMEVSAD
ncbi:MAG: EAL domain-containing protein, partial [Oscillospiraceae bacterium]|nr:EAL domain-containing protein [Oscillospiraceae bacterium]